MTRFRSKSFKQSLTRTEPEFNKENNRSLTMSKKDDGLKLGYLGCVPVRDVNEKVAKDSMGLLANKLQTLQGKMIDKIVGQKHGSRLSAASPVYQKVATNLRKQGMDCTMGDPCLFKTSGSDLQLVELKSGSTSSIPLLQIAQLSILPSHHENRVIFAFMQDGASTGEPLRCHGMLCPPHVANSARITIVEAIDGLGKMMPKAKKRSATAVPAGGDNGGGTITFGIGLHRKSSVKVSHKVRRQGTINLKGRNKGEVKRRSSSYGNTFASFGGSEPTSPVPGPVSPQPSVGAATDYGFGEEDDDLLSGFDDDWFGGDDDTLQADGNPNLVGNDDDAVDLSMFGFDGE